MKLKPVDVVVIALALGVGGGLIATALVPIVIKEPLSDARAQNVATIVGSVITLIAAYVTASLGGRNKDGEEDDDDRKG